MGAPQVPRKPETSQKKSISAVSVRTIGREGDHEERERERTVDNRARLEPLRTNLRTPRVGVELLPKPSDDPKDPLNWPTWKKELAFWSLLLSVAVVSTLKMIYVSTNSVIATEYNCSYMAAAAFTGLPFIFAALSSLGASVLSQLIGKRTIYISSGALMLIGAMWNMHVVSSYAQFMISRLFQGIGWGATEGLVMISIRDMFFVHERGMRINIYNTTAILFTWGSPILGGYVSQTNQGFRNALMVITIIQAFSVFFLIFLVPETSFSRVVTSTSGQKFGISSQISGPTPSAMKSYLITLYPVSYHSQFSMKAALKPIRALGAPTTILTFLATFPLIATSHGIAQSLSLLFAAIPTFIFPGRLGYIFILPLIMSLFGYIVVSLISRFRNSKAPSSLRMSEIIPGILLGSSGLIALGLYTIGQLSPTTLDNGVLVYSVISVMMFSLKAVSALFGMVVGGSVILSYTASQHLSSSSSMSSERPLETGHQFWQSVFSGVFIIAVPLWIQMGDGGNVGLKNMSIALGVVQLVLGSTVGAVMFMKAQLVERLDDRIMGTSPHSVGGSMELKGWQSQESFFDA